MLLALDIGNTEITMGIFRGAELEAHWRLTTNPGRTPDEWGSAIGGFLLGAGHSPNEVRAVCLASVAPSVAKTSAPARAATMLGAASPQPSSSTRLPGLGGSSATASASASPGAVGRSPVTSTTSNGQSGALAA